MCGMPGSAGYTMQEAPVGQEAGEASLRGGVGRNMGKRNYCGFCGKERDAGEAGSGWALLNNFSGLWGIGPVSSYLVPGPGMSGQVDSVLGYESLIEVVVAI